MYFAMDAVEMATCAVRSLICCFFMPFNGSALTPFFGAADICSVGGRTCLPWLATAF